jgi:hypothetical protein
MTATATEQSDNAIANADVTGDQMVSDILSAIAAGMDPESYILLRSAGATHYQAFEIYQWDWDPHDPLEICTRAIRAGATFSELCALERSIQAPDRYRCYSMWASAYADARESGITHNEFVYYEETCPGIGEVLNVIKAVRDHGTTHAQLVAYYNTSDTGVYWYARALELGASVTQVHEALDHEPSITCYVEGLQLGATHDELVEALNFGAPDVQKYIWSRRDGISHERAIVELAKDD